MFYVYNDIILNFFSEVSIPPSYMQNTLNILYTFSHYAYFAHFYIVKSLINV